MPSTTTAAGSQAPVTQADKAPVVYTSAMQVVGAVSRGELAQADAEAIIEELQAAAIRAASAKPSKAGKKTECPVTRGQFSTGATALEARVNGTPLVVAVKEFSTGSLGWYDCGKMTVVVDGVPCQAQYSVQLTLVGSKELPAS